MKSMTAYGRAARSTPYGSWVVEIHSVNRKLLDFNIYLPRELLSLDIPLRKYLAQSIFRGQVTLRITGQKEERGIDKNLQESLTGLKQEWDALAKALGFDPKSEVTLEFLLNQYGQNALSSGQDLSAVEQALQPVIDDALKEFHAMRQMEGDALEKDIRHRCALIENALKSIRQRTAASADLYRSQLMERIQVAGLESMDPDRLTREVVLLVDKADITEELTRLESHLAQMISNMNDKVAKGMGRTLDFLVQEMGRELNTIASKSSDLEITKEYIAAKSELEKMREQIQNIE